MHNHLLSSHMIYFFVTFLWLVTCYHYSFLSHQPHFLLRPLLPKTFFVIYLTSFFFITGYLYIIILSSLLFLFHLFFFLLHYWCGTSVLWRHAVCSDIRKPFQDFPKNNRKVRVKIWKKIECVQCTGVPGVCKPLMMGVFFYFTCLFIDLFACLLDCFS